ncbi:MAG: type II toxin-antitoxin system MqsA family antitoxin [Planctomycetes bacterium]|nr:type II toxin-antitoxin system MqsA family antitoxin [Planctomycetota bacterium]MBM4082061.1 type II toxin-antitoxin system MqsA family antitoxin [Planctomycetota bacterium]MBM4086236.1 type II toxin-antitoxin system MqsA family antitoxin [Planctomycetota bacterium]
MICDLCGKKGATIRHVPRSYGKGANLFVIENVPIVSCPHCGESYLTAETLHELERIKTHRRALAQERSVAVATFA